MQINVDTLEDVYRVTIVIPPEGKGKYPDKNATDRNKGKYQISYRKKSFEQDGQDVPSVIQNVMKIFEEIRDNFMKQVKNVFLNY